MSSSMKKATKMSVADFEAVQWIPDWAVFSFDSYMKYVGHGTLSHSEFLEYHTDWLKLVVKLDTKIFGNHQSRSKSKSHAKNPFIEYEAVNYGADDCEENEYESEPEVCSSQQATDFFHKNWDPKPAFFSSDPRSSSLRGLGPRDEFAGISSSCRQRGRRTG